MCSRMSEPVRGGGVLGPDELAVGLRSLSGWSVENRKLVKPYAFPDFVSAVGFVDRLTVVAEAQSHHPDLFVGWGKVTVQLSSHDVGGITARDLRLAAALDQL
jgi:4a-hydroxytetrahydrobiopterin dehydratase